MDIFETSLNQQLLNEGLTTKHEQKDMKLNLKQRIKRLLFWVIFLLIISLIFGILFKIFGYHWMYVIALIPWIPLILFIIVGILYAWVINPIRSLIKKKKNKKEEE